MRPEEKLPEDVQDALRKGLLKRLPLTFLPFTNQHLREWDNLFPYERQSVERLIVYVAGLSDDEFSSLFRDVVQLEEKMGVRHWKQFSTTEQTIENSSLLARSPYFQEWRKAVQAVFDVVDQHGPRTQTAAGKAERRLILLILPKPLPLDPETVWSKWQGIGRPLKLDLTSSGADQSPAQTLLGGTPGAAGARSGGLLDVALRRPDSPLADTWVCDAGSSLVDYLRTGGPAGATPPARHPAQLRQAGFLPGELRARDEYHAEGPLRRGRGVRLSAQSRGHARGVRRRWRKNPRSGSSCARFISAATAPCCLETPS